MPTPQSEYRTKAAKSRAKGSGLYGNKKSSKAKTSSQIGHEARGPKPDVLGNTGQMAGCHQAISSKEETG